MIRIRTFLLVAAALAIGWSARADSIPIQLTALDASVFPVGDPGGAFPVVDVTGLFGSPGADLDLSILGVGLLTNSGIPGANLGAIDPVAGTFALNWGFLARGQFLDAAGGLVGTATITGVLPETGTFDAATGRGTGQTSGFVTTSMEVFDPFGTLLDTLDLLAEKDNTFLIEILFPDPSPGEFEPNPGVAGGPIRLRLPPALGGGVPVADLRGNFEIRPVPEPRSILLLAFGAAALARRPKRRR